MKVIVNGKEIEIYSGAKAGDAVRAYFSERGVSVSLASVCIYDRWGYEVDPDGSINAGSRLEVKIKTKL